MGYSWFFRLFLLFVTFAVSSCATKTCAGEVHQEKTSFSVAFVSQSKKEVEKKMENKIYSTIEKIYVFKHDGTKQCEPKVPAIPQAQVEKELKSAQVKYFEIQHMDSGFMMIQMCGAPTGKIFRVQIAKEDLPKAIKLGYEPWEESD